MIGKVIAILLAIYLITNSLTAEVKLSGKIIGVEYWTTEQNPYIITEDLTIASTGKVIIAPGVIIKMNKGTNLIVQGAIVSVGTVNQRITFTANTATPISGFWGGILLDNTINDDETVFEFTEIQYGGGSVKTNSGLLVCDDVSPKIEYCTFAYSAYFGLIPLKTASPDLGGGEKNSAGYNSFFGFGAKKYAVFNQSTQNISAVYNCWGTTDESIISEIIYDKNDKSKYGYLIVKPFNVNCEPLPPTTTHLIAPENNSIDNDINLNIIWRTSARAESYKMEISSDSLFVSGKTTSKSLTDTFCVINNLKYNTKYFWRVRTINWVGESGWSTVSNFKTIDTSRPTAPELNLIAGSVNCSVNLSWKQLDNSYLYNIQISKDIDFSSNYYCDSALTATKLNFGYLDDECQYYWKVRAKNSNGWGEWSNSGTFYNSVCSVKTLPENWNFEKQTGENTTILIYRSVENSTFPRKLTENDVIGAFYQNECKLVCAGYCYFKPDENIAMTIWGDNPQTEIKDGFLKNEHIRYKIWDSKTGNEIMVYPAQNEGINYFKPDTLNFVSTFCRLDSGKIPVKKSRFEMIASNVAPFESCFDKILSKSVTSSNKFIVIKNANDEQYSNSAGTNQITEWNYLEGYEVFTDEDLKLKFEGEKITLSNFRLTVPAKLLTIIPFVPDSSMQVDYALSSIKDNILFLKDSEGKVYLPSINYSQIDSLKPQKAYKVYLSKQDVLFYPNVENKVVQTDYYNFDNEYFAFNPVQTGNNQIIFLELADAEDGDEIAVLNSNYSIIGTSKIYSQRAVITVWGKNYLLPDFTGAYHNEVLRLVYWNKKSNREDVLKIISINNFLNGENENYLQYGKDKFVKVVAKSSITGVTDENNVAELKIFPNPAKDLITINYFLNEAAKVGICVLDIFGEQVVEVFEQYDNAGNNSKNINLNNLQNGVYFFKININEHIIMKEILLIK